jgi:hypothetical protein
MRSEHGIPKSSMRLHSLAQVRIQSNYVVEGKLAIGMRIAGIRIAPDLAELCFELPFVVTHWFAHWSDPLAARTTSKLIRARFRRATERPVAWPG